jgi:hypothetical protein
MAINLVPISIEALQIGGYKAPQLLRVASGVNTSKTELSSEDWSNLQAFINGTSTTFATTAAFSTIDSLIQNFARSALPVCAGSQALTSNGSALSCIPLGPIGGTIATLTSAQTLGNPIIVGGTALGGLPVV